MLLAFFNLFNFYIHEAPHYIERFAGVCLLGIVILILLYVDGILLISHSPKGLQRHLNTLKSFCTHNGLSINLDKTKVMVFSTTQAWVTRSEPEFLLAEENVTQTQSYTYLGVTFIGLSSLYKRLIVLDFLVDMQPLVLLKTMCKYTGPRAMN